jgi:hypothetical protein
MRSLYSLIEINSAACVEAHEIEISNSAYSTTRTRAPFVFGARLPSRSGLVMTETISRKVFEFNED